MRITLADLSYKLSLVPLHMPKIFGEGYPTASRDVFGVSPQCFVSEEMSSSSQISGLDKLLEISDIMPRTQTLELLTDGGAMLGCALTALGLHMIAKNNKYSMRLMEMWRCSAEASLMSQCWSNEL